MTVHRTVFLLLLLPTVVACVGRPYDAITLCSGREPEALRVISHTIGQSASTVGRAELVVHFVSADASARPVRGTLAVFRDSLGSTATPLDSATAGADGIVSVSLAAPGTYWIRTRAVGYHSASGSVAVRGGSRDTLRLAQTVMVRRCDPARGSA